MRRRTGFPKGVLACSKSWSLYVVCEYTMLDLYIDSETLELCYDWRDA